MHKLLAYLYPDFSQQFRNYPNIEDFLNLLEMAKRFNTEEFIESNLWPPAKLEEVNRITLKAATEYIWDFMQDKQKLRVLYDYAAGNLRAGDTIITFNWDLTVERALEGHPDDFNISYFYSQDRDEDRVVLLKPHGSIDWFLKKKLPDEAKQNVMSLDKELCVYPYFDFAENPELLEQEPVIVPPLSSKEFEYGFLKRTWQNVYKAVSSATSLYIIGYSFPKEDQFARLVIRRGLRNNILRAERGKKHQLHLVVVNPDENVLPTTSKLFGPGVKDFRFHQVYFQDYTAGLSDES